MPSTSTNSHASASTGLVVGNHCHDVLFLDGRVIAESLGGSTSFISNVLDPLLLPCAFVSKVGPDFCHPVPHPPVPSPSPTTLFHAFFSSSPSPSSYRSDRTLRRVRACDPVLPSDLPDSRFRFGIAAGVAGEILPSTLARMLDLCGIVFVDAQALIRAFDPADGTVRLVPLKETGFAQFLPRIGLLKASADEAAFVDVEEARRWCCVAVTRGEEGCTVYWRDGEVHVPAFATRQVDPTGAGDSFLGGLVVGLVHGLGVADAAMLGNFFGSLTVRQIGVPKFRPHVMQAVRDKIKQKAPVLVANILNLEDSLACLGPDEEFQTFLAKVCKAAQDGYILTEDGKYLDEDDCRRETQSNPPSERIAPRENGIQ